MRFKDIVYFNKVAKYDIADPRGNLTGGDGLSQVWDNRNRMKESRITAANFLLGRYLYNERGLRLKAERFTLPTVQVVLPNGGESLYLGDVTTITWNSTNHPTPKGEDQICLSPVDSMGVTGTLKLELLVNDAVVGTIAENLPGTQTSYQWPVGNLLNGPVVNPGANFKVRVSSMALPIATTTYYFYDVGGRLLAEYDQSGACVKDYVYMGGKLLAEYQPVTSQYYYYTSDQINSTRLVTDSAGVVVSSSLYDPYGGEQKVWVDSYRPKLGFSGKERESSSELDYFGARYYGHRQYRFLSVDPVINKDEAFINPQLWNLYAYCGNNPVSRMDPDGRYVIANSDRMILNIAMMSVTPTGGGIFDALNNDSRAWSFIDGTNQNGAGGFIDPNIDISKSNGFVTGGQTTIDFNNIANYNLSDASSLRTTGHEASHLQAYSSSSQQTGNNFISAHRTATRQDQGGTNGTFNGPAGLVGQSIQGEFAGMMQNNPIGTSMMVSARAAQMRQTVNQIISFSLSLMGVSK